MPKPPPAQRRRPRLHEKHPGSGLLHMALWEIFRACCGLLLVGLYRGRWYGWHRVPPTGPVLIIANHQSFLDPPLIGFAAGPRHADFIGRAGLFRNPLVGRLLKMCNCVPVAEGGKSDTAAIRETIRRLEMGRVVVLFPEGSRSFDGDVHEFKRGVAVLLKRVRCPVLPAAVEGAFDAWPRTRPLPSPFGRVAVLYGDPIEPEDLLRDGPAAALDRLRDEVVALRQRLRLERVGPPSPVAAD